LRSSNRFDIAFQASRTVEHPVTHLRILRTRQTRLDRTRILTVDIPQIILNSLRIFRHAQLDQNRSIASLQQEWTPLVLFDHILKGANRFRPCVAEALSTSKARQDFKTLLEPNEGASLVDYLRKWLNSTISDTELTPNEISFEPHEKLAVLRILVPYFENVSFALHFPTEII